MQAEQASNGIGATGGPHAPAIPTKVPRFPAFLASLSQPEKRLNDALLARDLDRVRKILTNPATSRLIDKPTLNNALDWAIQATYKEGYALLIDAGADKINGSLYNYRLIWAVTEGERDRVAFLLDRGADVNYQSGDGTAYSSALRAAITNDDEAMITLVSQRGADLNAVRRYGYPTGIHEASARNRLAIVNLLINLGADFNSPQEDYGTPLMLSIYEGCFSTAELLIKRGAYINEVGVPLKYPGRLFHSAIQLAIYVSSPYLVALLLHHGIGTDLHEAYEFAAQHTVLLSRQLMPLGYDNNPHTDDPVTQFFYWETRKVGELLNHAREVQELLKNHIQRPAVRA